VDQVIGVDVHKKTHTLVVVDPTGRKVAEETIETTTAAHRDAMRWARRRFGDDIVWGVEDCRTLTARLEHDLLGAGMSVIRVPPHLTGRARSISRELGKSDPIDALAVARAVLREPNLPVASHDPVSMELRLLVDRRDDLVDQRIGMINRLIGRVHLLDPTRTTPSNWKTKKSRNDLQAWLRTQDGLLAELALEEFDDIDRLRASIETISSRISERVRAAAPALLTVYGCGDLMAAKIVAEVAGIGRFRSEAAFASYVGLAPIPHSSGGSSKLRSSRRGNRQLNMAIHRIAVVQIAHPGPGKDYYQRRLADGDARQRALRSLKRRIARVVYTRLKEQARRDNSLQPHH